MSRALRRKPLSMHQKQWKLSSVKAICRRIDKTASAVDRPAGSGRPKSARTVETVNDVSELINYVTSERHIHQHPPNCRRAGHQPVRPRDAYSEERPARQIASSCSAQIINDNTRLKRSTALLRRLNTRTTKQVFFTDEKNLNPPVSKQNSCV